MKLSPRRWRLWMTAGSAAVIIAASLISLVALSSHVVVDHNGQIQIVGSTLTPLGERVVEDGKVPAAAAPQEFLKEGGRPQDIWSDVDEREGQMVGAALAAIFGVVILIWHIRLIRRHDFFVCHASEDKEEVAIPLAEELRRCGHRVWVDLREIKVGDSLEQRITEGIRGSRFGILVLSEHFYDKIWTTFEFDRLLEKEFSGQGTILPIWHRQEREDVEARYGKTIADKFAGSTREGIEPLAHRLHEHA